MHFSCTRKLWSRCGTSGTPCRRRVSEFYQASFLANTTLRAFARPMYSAISTCTHVLYSCTRLDWKIWVICENLGLVYYSSLLNRFLKCLFQVSGGCIDSGFSLTSRLVPPCSLILAWINGQDLICDPLFISSPTVPVIFPTFPVIFQILSSIFLF